MSNNKSIALRDLKVGESVVGYVAKLFKAPNSKTPDVENIALVTKDGSELTVWASGTLRYFRERMEKAGVAEGVLTKITRIEKPTSAKSKDQKYYAEILFNPNDTKDPSSLNTYNNGGSGNNGIAEF